jgi:hypothetical protein
VFDTDTCMEALPGYPSCSDVLEVMVTYIYISQHMRKHVFLIYFLVLVGLIKG